MSDTGRNADQLRRRLEQATTEALLLSSSLALAAADALFLDDLARWGRLVRLGGEAREVRGTIESELRRFLIEEEEKGLKKGGAGADTDSGAPAPTDEGRTDG